MKRLVDKEYLIQAGWRKFEHELERRERKRAKRRGGASSTKFKPKQRPKIVPFMLFLRETIQGKSIAILDTKTSQWVLKLPSVFSFIKNPDETLNAIFSLVDISRHSKIRKVFLDHTEVREIDMAASAVFDVVAMNMRKEWTDYEFSGRLPKDPAISEFIKSMGITKHLNIQGAEPSKFSQEMYVCFPLYSGYGLFKNELTGDQQREKAVTQLVAYIDECLMRASNYCLSDEGTNSICRWAGEIITNAEEHSGHKQWYAIGCMRPLPANEPVLPDDEVLLIGECQLTIFGFGESIYESLSSPKTPEGTRAQIGELVSKHTGFFNSFEKYSFKDLWTLYALQDGVSRYSKFPGQSSRGKGTVEMIETFQAFKSVEGTFNPEMSLISGSSSIYFNEKYHLKEQEVLGGKCKIIAFNEKNSLEEKPDSKHVRSLEGHFPGTLLTFKFFVDSRYLDKVQEQLKKEKTGNGPVN